MSFLICIKAGTNLETLTKILSLVSQHPTLQGATRFIASVAPKDGLAAAIDRTHLFTPDVISGIRVGEQTGRLEQQLQIILKECRARIEFNIKVFKEWAPRALYALIAAFVILNILVISLSRR